MGSGLTLAGSLSPREIGQVRPSPPPRRPIEFTEALRLLHAMIGIEVEVVVNLLGYFLDCGFHARLESVQALAEDEGSVLIVFDGAQGVALDPTEAKAFLAGSDEHGERWLEIRIGRRARVVIEPRDPRPGGAFA
jgi:hypothetical protein